MAEEFGGIIRLFFVVCLSICVLATCLSEVTNRRYGVLFECKSTTLKRESQQTPYLLLRFGSWVKLKVHWILSGFPLKFTVNLKAKCPFKFLSFLELTNSAAEVRDFISDNFPDRSTIMMAKNSDINIPLPQQCFVQFV